MIWVAFAILCAIGLSRLAEWSVLDSMDEDWTSTRQHIAGEISSDVQRAFAGYQKEVHRIAIDLGRTPMLRESLRESSDSIRSRAFRLLAEFNLPAGMSAELLDARGLLIAWQGRAAGINHAQLTIHREESFLFWGSVYSYLTIVVPVISEEVTIGAVVVHRLFDVNFPLSNRFISREAFTGTFTNEIQFPVSLWDADLSFDDQDRAVLVPLAGLDGGSIGYLSLDLPSQAENARATIAKFGKLKALLGFLFSLTLGIILLDFIKNLPSKLARILGVSILLWALRYSWLAVGFPSVFGTGGVFDPRLFASSFGGGLAKSIMELFLTVSILIGNVIYVASQVWTAEIIRLPGRIPRHKTTLMIVFSVLIGALSSLLLRGFAASARSAVFDSTLQFNDPASVFPTFTLAMLLLSLFGLALALVVTIFLLLSFIRRLTSQPMAGILFRSLLSVALLVLGDFLFTFIVEDTLVPWFGRIGFLLILYGATAGSLSATKIVQSKIDWPDLFRLRRLLPTMILAIILPVLLLDYYFHEKERNRIELYASQLARPIDSWAATVVEQALREIAGSGISAAISSGRQDMAKEAAFRGWASSLLSREGFNSAVALLDDSGAVLSEFGIGLKQIPHAGEGLLFRRADSLRTPVLLQLAQTGRLNRTRVYRGYASIPAEPGHSSAYLRVDVALDQEHFLRPAASPILRASEEEWNDMVLGTPIISEFVGGEQTHSTGQAIPRKRRLPELVGRWIGQEGADNQSGLWTTEKIDGNSFDSFFKPIEGQSGRVIALSIPDRGWQWHFFDILRLAFFEVLILIAATALIGLFLVFRGGQITINFRSRLMGAFAVVTLLPVMAIAYFDREITIERAGEVIVERLSEASAALRSGVLNVLDSSVEANRTFERVNDAWAEEIAVDVGTDFSLYVDANERGSSKPELFKAEILDRRLSGEAYRQVVLDRKDFFAENQMIGTFTYLIGYRPLIDIDDRVRAVLAVPILYRHQEINEEVSRRQALLFGGYTFILVFAMLMGGLFANQISSPIRRLIQATRSIASGDLDFRLTEDRKDELGELHRAFNTMTEDLKRNRQDLIRAERELAWKEMAKQIAHEIKNPLTPMKLSIQHLRQAYRDGDPRFSQLLEQVARTITEQVDSLSRIASEFSRFALMPRRREERIDVASVVHEAVQLFGEYKKIVFEMDFQTDEMVVLGDSEEFRRALINILRNSVQAIEEIGKITIRTERPGALIRIEITDTGPGISAEILPKLFEPTFSTKTDGMGLGLAIVKKTIEDMGGSIEIESQKEKGTVVRIILPCAVGE